MVVHDRQTSSRRRDAWYGGRNGTRGSAVDGDASSAAQIFFIVYHTSFDISFYICRKKDFVHFVQLLASISYSDTLCTHVTPEPTPSSRATVDSHLYIILLNLRAGGLIEVNERCTTGR